MKISVHTNILARALPQHDEEQARKASQILEQASLIAVSLTCMCELAWLLLRGAQLAKQKVLVVIRALPDAGSVVMNRRLSKPVF